MEIATLLLTGLNILIIPFLLWYLNSKTTKQIEELKIKNDLKIQTYKKLFDIFNSILAKDNSVKWNPKDRIDLVVDLLKYAPDEIVNKFVSFWNQVKTGDMEKANLSPLYEDILLLVRHDLGHKDSKIDRKQVIELLLSKKKMGTSHNTAYLQGLKSHFAKQLKFNGSGKTSDMPKC